MIQWKYSDFDSLTNKILTYMAKKYPKGIKCQNPKCDNTMLIESHSVQGNIPFDTPEEEIHTLNGVSKITRNVLCASCSHYTICKQ